MTDSDELELPDRVEADLETVRQLQQVKEQAEPMDDVDVIHHALYYYINSHEVTERD